MKAIQAPVPNLNEINCPAARHKCTFNRGFVHEQNFPIQKPKFDFHYLPLLGDLDRLLGIFMLGIWKGQPVGFFFAVFRSGNVCWCVKGKTKSCGPVIFPEFDRYLHSSTYMHSIEI